MTQPTTAREAAERNAQAIMSGNLSQLMADITPEVLAQVMAMGAQAGGLSPAQMPNIEGYELKDFGPQEDGGELFTLQQRRVLTSDPELLRQAAHLVAQDAASRDGELPEVRVDAMVSFNGRPAARLIDPDVDLAAEPWRLGPQPWILPVPRTAPPSPP